MKICLVAQTFAPQEEGGAEILARMCAVELARHHDVFVLSLGLEGDTLVPPGETVGKDGTRVVRIGWNNSYLPGPRKPTVGTLDKITWHLRAAIGATSKREIRDILAREKVDLIYAHNSARMQPALFEASRALDLPLCLHLHDYALLCPKSSMFRNGENCREPCLECRVLTSRLKSNGQNVTVIAVSEALKQRYVKAEVLAKADWHVLHNTYLRESDLPKAAVRRTSPQPGPFTIGYVGALSEEKGIETAIEAVRVLCDRHDLRLIVAGRGRPDYEDALKRLAAHAPVEFLGFVDAQAVYDAADMVVVPSIWQEPQGMILIEAAIRGVPVIGTTRGGIPEVVSGTEIGWTYDPGEAGTLASLIEKALSFGKDGWWQSIDEHFPGLRDFKGTSEATHYYERLETILRSARDKHPKSD